MKKLALILALAACAGTSTRWSTVDVASEGALVAVSLVDWRQTVDITRGCTETNPVLGRCGERVPMNLAFPVVLALHVLISAILPHGDARSAWQWTTLGGESLNVWLNWREGYWPQVGH